MPAKKAQQKTKKRKGESLVQVWITGKAKGLLKQKADKAGLQVASYVRQMIYSDISSFDELDESVSNVGETWGSNGKWS